jgi:hypothetical protein
VMTQPRKPRPRTTPTADKPQEAAGAARKAKPAPEAAPAEVTPQEAAQDPITSATPTAAPQTLRTARSVSVSPASITGPQMGIAIEWTERRARYWRTWR